MRTWLRKLGRKLKSAFSRVKIKTVRAFKRVKDPGLHTSYVLNAAALCFRMAIYAPAILVYVAYGLWVSVAVVAAIAAFDIYMTTQSGRIIWANIKLDNSLNSLATAIGIDEGLVSMVPESAKAKG